MPSAAQWERVGGSADTVDRVVGRVDTEPGEGHDGATRRAIERQLRDLAGLGALAWADPQLAWGWIKRAVELSTPEERARLDRATYAEQTAATLALWEALGNAYRAMDLPPTSDPAYVLAFTSRTIGGDTRVWCEAGAWFREVQPYLYTGTDGVTCSTIHGRLGLAPDGTVVRTYLDPTVPVSDYSHWEHRLLPHRVYDWAAVSFHHECLTRTDFSGCRRYTTHVFPPLRWYFDLAAEVARALAARGVLKTAFQSFRYVLSKNLATAAEVDGSETSLLSRMGLTTGNILRVTSELAGRASDSVAHAAETARADTLAGVDRWGAAVGAAAPVLALAVPGVGPLIAGVMGLGVAAVRLIATVIPLAAADDRDLFGRTRPVMERRSITGGSDVEPPNHDVPAPPGWRRIIITRLGTDGVGELDGGAMGPRRPTGPKAPGSTEGGAASGAEKPARDGAGGPLWPTEGGADPYREDPRPSGPPRDDGPGLGTVAVGAAGVGVLAWWLSRKGG